MVDNPALTRHAATRPATLPDRQGRVDRAAIARARGLLRQQFAENITADELSRVAGCSHFTLHRGFRAAYGFAPSDYQRDLRLRRARVLLAEGTTPSRRPPRPASPTRPISPDGSPAPTVSPRLPIARRFTEKAGGRRAQLRASCHNGAAVTHHGPAAVMKPIRPQRAPGWWGGERKAAGHVQPYLKDHDLQLP
ncbi:helix-turn-helix domain-containing protein [Streptomyces platensis]|uniref:Helix-turn-helix domain-containing protein n=1 Tax=Streptomyces platensis TaxID=58346 RepID=A0AAE6TQ11_STRPT|nr:helix-turn-helix domain-containing protein [Streptomyces platensis]